MDAPHEHITSEHKSVLEFNKTLANENRDKFDEAVADFILNAVRQKRRMRMVTVGGHRVCLISWNPAKTNDSLEF